MMISLTNLRRLAPVLTCGICLLQEAECEKVMMDTKFDADTKIADSARMFEMSKAGFQAEVNTKVGHLMWVT